MLRSKTRAALIVVAMIVGGFVLPMVNPAPAQAVCITIPPIPPLFPDPIEICV